LTSALTRSGGVGATITGSAGDGITVNSAGSNGHGINASGNGTGHGILATGGTTGHGLSAVGGNTSGNGINATVTSGTELRALPTFSVQTDAGNSATAVKTNRTEATNDFWKDALLVIRTGALKGQVKKVSAYDGTTKIITVSSAFTGTPADGVVIDLVNQ